MNLQGRLDRTALEIRNASIVWVFHDVGDADWFQSCIDQISSMRRVLPLVELARNPGVRRACAITFDDGLRSVAEVAHPVLAARRLPYTVFVCTDVLTGGPVPWFLRVAHLFDCLGPAELSRPWETVDERLHRKQDLINALKQEPLSSILEGLDELEERYSIPPPDPGALFLSAEEVSAISAAGASIGSHTHRHPILSLLTVQQQRFEIEESARVIEELTGGRPAEFAYPNGTSLDFTAATMTVLRACDIRVAVTTRQRQLSRADDPLALPRIGLSRGDSYVRRALKSVVPWTSTSHRREHRLRSRIPRRVEAEAPP